MKTPRGGYMAGQTADRLIPVIGHGRDGRPIYAIAGATGFAISDLEALKTVEEYATYQVAVRARIQEIDRENAGKPLSDELRSEWADLRAIDKRVGEIKTELEARRLAVEEIATGDTRSLERELSATPRQRAGSAIRSRHVPEDIYAVEQYRGLSSTDEQLGLALVDGAKMAIERTAYPHERADETRIRGDLLTLIGKVDKPDVLARRVLTTGQSLYARAFGKMLAGQGLFADEQRALDNVRAAMTLGSDAAGGFPVPFQLDPTLILTSDGVVNPLRQISRTERITGKKWQGVSTAGVTANYGTEAAPAADQGSKPILEQPEVDTAEAKVFVPFSRTLDAAWGALASELARIFQDAKDTLEGDKLVNGSGTNEPHGIVATLDPSYIVWTNTVNALGIEDLFAMRSGHNAVPPRFRARASWLGSAGFYDYIRMLSVGTVGQGSVWVPGIADGQPDRLLGRPAFEASEMDAEVKTGNDVAVLGDFGQFLIVDRIGMAVEIIPHLFDQATARPTGQRGAFAIWANQSLILVQNAFRRLRVGTGS